MSAVPVHKPIIVSRPKARPELRIEQGTKSSALTSVLAQAVLFGVLTLAVFLASSLSGQVMVEKARRDGIRAIERNKDSAKDVALLRAKVQEMTQSSAIDAWATLNHFVAPEALVAENPQAADLPADKDGDAKKHQ